MAEQLDEIDDLFGAVGVDISSEDLYGVIPGETRTAGDNRPFNNEYETTTGMKHLTYPLQTNEKV